MPMPRVGWAKTGVGGAAHLPEGGQDAPPVPPHRDLELVPQGLRGEQGQPLHDGFGTESETRH